MGKKQSRPLADDPLVLIEWLDASRIFDGWLDLKDVPASTPHKCVSVGFLVSENLRLGKPTQLSFDYASEEAADTGKGL